MPCTDINGYEAALETAGAEILDFDMIGGSAGLWVAEVTYNGVTGWVTGEYSDCKCCDRFLSELANIELFSPENAVEALTEFGERYLKNILSEKPSWAS